MTGGRIPIGLWLAAIVLPTRATPFDDLASPSPEVRANAANQIRKQHLIPSASRERWTHLLAGVDLKKLDAGQTLLILLRPYTAVPSSFPSDGGIGFPLDSYWLIFCETQNKRLMNFEIRPMEFWVKPPSHFSGFWRTYRADGTLAADYDYQNGRNLGDTLHMQ